MFIRRFTLHQSAGTRWIRSLPGKCQSLDSELNQLDVTGVDPTPATYISLIRQCTNASEAKRVHRHILSGPHCDDRLLLNLLLQLYGKLSLIQDARALFNRIDPKNVFTWTIMISANAHSGHRAEALHLFHQMLLDGSRPDKVGFLAILESCTWVFQAECIHSLIIEAGLEHITFLSNALMNLYGKGGDLLRAEELFDRMPRRDLVSWNTLITAYAQYGDSTRALELFNRMRTEGVQPDRVTFIGLLEACKTGDREQIEEIREMIVEQGLESDLVLANSLIAALGSSGAVELARQVFDRLGAQRDVISWNSIIGAYAQKGHSRVALELFRRMDLESVSHNEVTFVSVLGAGEIGGSELEMIQQRARATGLIGSNTVVGNSLMHRHGRIGRLDQAKEVFDSMSERSVSSWNSIVDAYAQNGHEDEALKFFRGMQLEGVRSDKVTFLALLNICRSLVEGDALQEQIRASGLSSDVAIQTAIVQMLARVSGGMEKALEAFDRMEKRDLFAWNSLLSAFAQSGICWSGAMRTFWEMNLEGIRAGELTFVSLIDSCASSCDLDRGRQVHLCAQEANLDQTSISVGNTLINLYAKSNDPGSARVAFDSMQEWNTISWNALASAHSDDFAAVITLLSRMQLLGFKPDRITFFSCLEPCRELDQVRKIHTQIRSLGLENDPAVANSLINAYRKCQSLEEARKIFHSINLRSRDVVSWSSMISACVEAGLWREALQISHEMFNHGGKPDSLTSSRLLEAHGCSGNLIRARELHDHIRNAGMEKNSWVASSLIGMYSACNDLEAAAEVFNAADAGNWDLLLCNSMLASFCMRCRDEECIELFKRMDLQGVNPMSRSTLNTVLDTCAGAAELAQARRIHSSISSSSVFLTGEGWIDVILGNTLINMYGKCGSLADARQVFDSMVDRALVTWNSIISVTAQHGEAIESRKLFRKMQQEGFKPDNVALMSVASACHHSGLLDEAFFYLFQVANEYGVEAKRERYSCIAGLLGRLGWLEEAEAMVRRMPFQADESVLMNLLAACKIHHDVDRGARIAKEIWCLDSDASSGAYVALYNLHAGAETRMD